MRNRNSKADVPVLSGFIVPALLANLSASLTLFHASRICADSLWVRLEEKGAFFISSDGKITCQAVPASITKHLVGRKCQGSGQ